MTTASALRNKRYRARHREELHARYLLRRDELTARRRLRYREAPETKRAADRRYYLTHRDEVNRRNMERARRNPVATRARVRKWMRGHPEKVRSWVKAWKQRNPGQASDRTHRRRARQMNSGLVDRINREAVWLRDHGFCGICGWFVPFEHFHLDHMIPLARGGSHTYANVQVTHGRCNQVKAALLPSELEAERRLAEAT